MDTAFTHLLAMLCDIADPRRAEGKLYGLPHVFLFSILAVMAGANSYRAIHSFIDVHLHRLKQTFGLNWRRAPAYTTVRGILQGVAAGDVEAVFRLHAQILNESAACQGMRVVAFDGKTLRGSFDKFTDTRPAHLVSAFAADSALVLDHLEIDDKSNEIPAVQRLLGELGLAASVVTVDALHCQKKTFERAAQRGLRLIAQVKANQPTLLGDVQRLCDEHEPIDRHETTDTRAGAPRDTPHRGVRRGRLFPRHRMGTLHRRRHPGPTLPPRTQHRDRPLELGQRNLLPRVERRVLRPRRRRRHPGTLGD